MLSRLLLVLLFEEFLKYLNETSWRPQQRLLVLLLLASLFLSDCVDWKRSDDYCFFFVLLVTLLLPYQNQLECILYFPLSLLRVDAEKICYFSATVLAADVDK